MYCSGGGGLGGLPRSATLPSEPDWNRIFIYPTMGKLHSEKEADLGFKRPKICVLFKEAIFIFVKENATAAWERRGQKTEMSLTQSVLLTTAWGRWSGWPARRWSHGWFNEHYSELLSASVWSREWICQQSTGHRLEWIRFISNILEKHQCVNPSLAKRSHLSANSPNPSRYSADATSPPLSPPKQRKKEISNTSPSSSSSCF